MEKVTKEIKICDENHIFIEGEQYISLKKVCDIKSRFLDEMENLDDLNKALTEENKSLKILLKDKLNQEIKEGD